MCELCSRSTVTRQLHGRHGRGFGRAPPGTAGTGNPTGGGGGATAGGGSSGSNITGRGDSAGSASGYSIFFGPPKYEFDPWSKAKVERNRWQCVELFEDGSSLSEEKRRVWLDGQELADLRSTSANPGAPTNHQPRKWSHAAFGVWETPAHSCPTSGSTTSA